MPRFPRKHFESCHSKICQKVKNTIFKCSEHWLLTLRKLQKLFLKCFLWTTVNLNSFEHFTFLSQKMVSTLSLKNLQKSGKYHFQTLKYSFFYLKVAGKLFSKMSPMTYYFLFLWIYTLSLLLKYFFSINPYPLTITSNSLSKSFGMTLCWYVIYYWI